MTKPKSFQTGLRVVLLVFVLALSTKVAISATTSGIGINEVLFNPDAGGYQWVELKNTGTTAVNIGSYRLTNEDGVWYTIPAALPAVPSGAFVVVIFDGAGSVGDEYSFSDNMATLHTEPGFVNILGSVAGQCALYSPGAGSSIYLPIILNAHQSWNPVIPGPPSPFPEPSIQSFVAWGSAPENHAAEAGKAGIWSPGSFISLTRGMGEILIGQTCAPNETIGLLPGSLTGHQDNWTLYPAAQATRGSENPVPVITWFNPANGEGIEGNNFQLSWTPVSRATGYRFQMDGTGNFSSPLVDVVLSTSLYKSETTVAPATYFWRVKVLSAAGESPWSTGVQIKSLALSGSSGSSVLGATQSVLGIKHQRQLKDTYMLCLGGCKKSEWDQPHTYTETDHSKRYCARATTSMMASYYGGQLSQDRITYELFKNNPPEGDLGHGIGTADQALFWPLQKWPTHTKLLAWALRVETTAIDVQDEWPTWDQLKQWIDAGRPIEVIIPGHIRVIDGYREVSEGCYQRVHYLDPTFVKTDHDEGIWGCYGFEADGFLVGPVKSGAPNVRSDEVGIWERRPNPDVKDDLGVPKDSDGDKICDFDELYRFHTNPHLPDGKDSDHDGIEDKIEIMSYLFAENGEYLPVIRPDIDRDGLRNELDPDSDNQDNKGTIDGCEDIDQDGIWQPGETRNNDPSDDKSLLITLTWENIDRDLDLHLIKPGGQMWKNTDCNYLYKNPDWGKPNVGNLNCGDPKLDTDCITSCTVEHINLDTLESGTYHVKVHYYSDHGNGPESPKVNVWLQGKSYDFGPLKIADDEVWDVCTIDWPSKTVTDGGAVTSLSPAGRIIKPGK
jgi:hypothetical protein